ncbi:MAG: hypothetical protein H6816_09445 [Phycisphaerales bacterium]|nr:hypothetical protein [Phycisphaerales bacterium]
MPMVSTNCGICGQPADPIDYELTGGIWTPVTCAECARRRLVADGGIVVQLLAAPKGALFELGEVHLRPGALHVLTESGQHFWPFLVRHAQGDTGVFVTRHAGQTPRPQRYPSSKRRKTSRTFDTGHAYLNSSGNVVSEYRTAQNRRLWIVTAPGKVTIIMAPGEY